MPRIHFRTLISTLAVACLTATSLRAQQGMGIGAYNSPPGVVVYVNPIGGSDTPSAPEGPYRTINAAIAAAESQLPGNQDKQALVQCMPGLYSFATNNEVLPIQMKPRVHVQGTGAKECVIRGDGTTAQPVWVPLASAPTNRAEEIIVDFSSAVSTLQADRNRESMIDGFTFQGGFVQAYFPVLGSQVRGRVSNCLFDMRDGGIDGLTGPSFGVLMVSLFDGSGGVPYHSGEIFVLNNTFLHGWNKVPSPEVSVPEAVAICNMTDGLDGSPSIGLNTPSIQNNLIRHHPDHPRVAFLGVDRPSTSTAGNQRTNAFDPTQPYESNGTYASLIAGGSSNQPITAVNLDIQANRPGFIGEFLSHSALHFFLPNRHLRDFRILPQSSVIDQGQAPQNDILVAGNGTTYYEMESFVSSFDWDGEGHGNPRVEGNAPDIGFDELGAFIVCASYGNDSRSHDTPYHPTVQQGNTWKVFFLPDLGTYSIRATMLPWFPAGSYLRPPGSIEGLPTTLGTEYLNPAQTLVAGSGAINVFRPYTDPIGTSYQLATTTEVPLSEPPTPQHVCQQWIFEPFFPLGSAPILTNLQREIF